MIHHIILHFSFKIVFQLLSKLFSLFMSLRRKIFNTKEIDQLFDLVWSISELDGLNR